MHAEHLLNVLGRVALGVADAVEAALADAAPALAAGDRTALLALHGFADGGGPGVLRDALGLSQPGVAHVVRRLTEAGLVERTVDPADGRGARLHLTRRGAGLAGRLARARTAALAHALAPLAPEELAALGPVLERLAPLGVDSTATARRACRLCDTAACGHPDGCPVTRHVDALGR